MSHGVAVRTDGSKVRNWIYFVALSYRREWYQMVNMNIVRTYNPVAFCKTEAANYTFAPIMTYTGLTSGAIPFIPVHFYPGT